MTSVWTLQCALPQNRKANLASGKANANLGAVLPISAPTLPHVRVKFLAEPALPILTASRSIVADLTTHAPRLITVLAVSAPLASQIRLAAAWRIPAS